MTLHLSISNLFVSLQGLFRLIGLFLIALAISFDGQAQASVPTSTQDMVKQQVEQELDQWQNSEWFQELASDYNVQSGFLILELSIYNKGRVRSIFQVDSNIENVPFRNEIKNYLKEHRFDLKKMNKKTTQKVQYTFNIN